MIVLKFKCVEEEFACFCCPFPPEDTLLGCSGKLLMRRNPIEARGIFYERT